MQGKQLINEFTQRNTISFKQKTVSTSKLKIKIIASNLPLNFFKPNKIQSQNHSFQEDQNVEIVTPSFGFKDMGQDNQLQEKIKQKWFIKKKNALTHRAQTEPLQQKQFPYRQLYTKQERRSNQSYKRQNYKNYKKLQRKTLIPKRIIQNNIQKRNNKDNNSSLQKRLSNKYSWEKIKPQKKVNFLGNFAFQNHTQDKQLLKNFNKNLKSFRPKKLLPPINIQNSDN